MVLYDPDTVEEANLSGQMFSKDEVGKAKVSAISCTVQRWSDYYDVYCMNKAYDHTCSPTSIMMCGLDNMKARKLVFASWYSGMKYAEDRSRYLFIDGRLLLDEFQIFAIQGDDSDAITRYRTEWLFDDKDAEEPVCSRKQTTFMASMIASHMVNIFTCFMGENRTFIPFCTYYNANSMMLKMSDR